MVSLDQHRCGQGSAAVEVDKILAGVGAAAIAEGRIESAVAGEAGHGEIDVVGAVQATSDDNNLAVRLHRHGRRQRRQRNQIGEGGDCLAVVAETGIEAAIGVDTAPGRTQTFRSR